MDFPFKKRLPKIDEEQLEQRKKEISGMKISRSEKFTMVWTAFLWIYLPCIGILLLIVFLALLIFGLL